MCVAVPTRIESIDGEQATVNLAGARTRVSVALVPEAAVGDWVLVHAGFAIARLEASEAHETFAILREAGGMVTRKRRGMTMPPDTRR